MRNILILCGVVLVIGTGLLVRALRVPTQYGAFAQAARVEVADVIASPKKFLHKTIALEDVIRKQCTSMGCYFFFQAGDQFLRIELAEIAMHAPKKHDGRKARVEGQLIPYGDGYQVIATAVEFE